MKTEAAHSQASAEKHTPGPIEQLLRDQEKEINRLRDVQKELLEALKAADRVLFLLSDEVKRLGFDSAKVTQRIKDAIAKAEKQP